MKKRFVGTHLAIIPAGGARTPCALRILTGGGQRSACPGIFWIVSSYLCVLLIIGFFCGCSKSANDSVSNGQPVHKHEHHPLHGGTPVVLGNEEYHMELVLDPVAGKLQAFVLDGEMENFIRIPAKAIEIDAQVTGHDEPLKLQAVANSATGETVGDTSLFETQADSLKTTTNFDAVLKEINVRGKTYSNVKFNFPKGNDEDAK